ncbi:undecaprenyldiphospho-muramoylpentapeptide beta-N-acetylglucosaminyltransferase [Alcanivorax quisquiliarum]|uniref:UDP-N-acetylglucosamine--N-acetylmuramyl-(pentapeptide) pyrophosphoryl-undecaprenol N-acetylglucosamine transferase n=1 Tax=Alcanivorax quisquiliarum TaxID=2933565 RepID=A0ABT0E7Y4_9GAMM|nr:undecaprenyldiphospho-muramoylpentapeptide beta-N-acetylglucosaminyltransferase [Alcanivorax quisquiliarum]MCK0537952.1 undecaprenyldiphospho-muramoylpentapeptide beta-N-acetylglucosaminyltransferase [Alcanivorax quisquiliarum]
MASAVPTGAHPAGATPAGTILIMAGGTGGHVFPALAVADVLRERGYEIHWLGSEHGIENRLVPAAGYPLHTLAVQGVRGGGLRRKLQMPLQLLRAVLAARKKIHALSPRLVLGFGGFASGPGGIAARLCGVPLVIHEQNAIPGLTNRVLARFSTRTLAGFDGAFKSKAVFVGNPVRDAIAALPTPAERYTEREGPLRILVLGGSQGAQALNNRLPAALAGLFGDEPVMVRHQAGRGQVPQTETLYQAVSLPATVEEFIDDMAAAYGWADLVICRAGASTVSELAVAGLAALFVPLPTAVDDHQTHNASWLAARNAARLLPQQALDAGGLAEKLAGLRDRSALLEMATRAHAVALPGSATRVADICEEVLRG